MLISPLCPRTPSLRSAQPSRRSGPLQPGPSFVSKAARGADSGIQTRRRQEEEGGERGSNLQLGQFLRKVWSRTGRQRLVSTAIQARGGSWKAATAALWTGKRPPNGDWATETRQGVSRGGGGGGDGRVAPSVVARFCADGRQCALRSVGNGRFVDEKTPPERRLGCEMWQGVSRGGGGGGDGRVAPSGVAQFCADGRQCALRSVGNGRFVDGKTTPEWRLDGKNAAGRFPWGGAWLAWAGCAQRRGKILRQCARRSI